MQQVKKPNDNKHCASSKTINIQEENHKINIKTPSSRHQACTQSDNAKSIKILQSTAFLSSESIASTIIQLQAQVQRASLRSQHKHKSKQASNSPYNPPTSRAAYDPPRAKQTSGLLVQEQEQLTIHLMASYHPEHTYDETMLQRAVKIKSSAYTSRRTLTIHGPPREVDANSTNRIHTSTAGPLRSHQVTPLAKKSVILRCVSSACPRLLLLARPALLAVDPPTTTSAETSPVRSPPVSPATPATPTWGETL